MNKTKKNKFSELSHEEAAQWLVQLECDPSVSEDDLIRLKAWLFENPENEVHFSQVENIWQDLKELDGDTQINSYLEEDVDFSADKKFSLPKISSAFKALAACFILCAVSLLSYNLFLNQNSVQHLQTLTGEQAHYKLDDGSEVILNTGTEIRVEYSDAQRKITLERGEALFDVAPDKNRPFIVYAGIGEVKALGTKFTVRKKEDLVTVALLEGEVKVQTILQNATARHKKIQYSQILQAGKSSRYSVEAPQPLGVNIKPDEALEWTYGRISFSDKHLFRVIEEVNRYTTTKLVLNDKSLMHLRINAYFNIDDMGALLFALKETFNIHSKQVGNQIYLYRIEDDTEEAIDNIAVNGHKMIGNATT